MAWKIVGASVRGPDHEADGTPCQDSFAHELRGDRLIAAVSDGAGSARFSDEGSRRLCEMLVARLGALDAPLPDGESDEERLLVWRSCAEEAIADLRAELLARTARALAGRITEDKQRRPELKDYSATLAAVVAEADRGLFLHIGDGAGAAVPDLSDWSKGTVSRPENGAFANETFFFTGADWRERLRLTPFGASALIVLVSDGAMPFTMAEKYAGLEGRFMEPVTRFLETAGEEDGAQALAATLNRADARRISGDDKTLLWTRRQER